MTRNFCSDESWKMEPRKGGTLGATTWPFPWGLFLGCKLGVSLCLCGLGEATPGDTSQVCS